MDLLELIIKNEKDGNNTSFNKYFDENPDVHSLLDTDNEKCKEFISHLHNINFKLGLFLERISQTKQIKRHKKTLESTGTNSKKIKIDEGIPIMPAHFFFDEYLRE